MLELCPISLKEAKEFVNRYHRHSRLKKMPEKYPTEQKVLWEIASLHFPDKIKNY